MMALDKKSALALAAVLDIALNARPGPVSAAAIAGRQKIARRYLEQMLQKLVKAGILTGQRGPRGGYALGRERRRISVGDIVRTAQNGQNGFIPDSPLGQAIIAPLAQQACKNLMEYLDAMSVDDVLADINAAKTGGGRIDFTI